jgi:hypothetical protein
MVPEGGGNERYEGWERGGFSGLMSETSEMEVLRISMPARELVARAGVFAAAFLAGALDAEAEGFGAGKGVFPAVGGGRDFGTEALRACAWVISLPLECKVILYLGKD